MPTPERTSLDAIIDAGRDLLEADGVEGLTMQAVADRVGVRAPSLYKRVRNRDELIARIAEATLRELSARLDDAADPIGDRLHGEALDPVGLEQVAPGADDRVERRAFRCRHRCSIPLDRS